MGLPFSIDEIVAAGGKVRAALIMSMQYGIVQNRTDLAALSGTWTPELRLGSDNAATQTVSDAYGEYVIHDQVASLTGTVTFTTDATGLIYITGLPVDPSNRPSQFGGNAVLLNQVGWDTRAGESWIVEAGFATRGYLNLYSPGILDYLSNPGIAGNKTISFHAIVSRVTI